MDDEVNLNPLESDALHELGNVATGNAATALSKFIGKNVDMNIPSSGFIPLSQFADHIGGPEKVVSAIYLQIEGDLVGEVLFIFPEEGALELADLAMGQPPGTSKLLEGIGESAFKEVSNILTGSFLNALSRMLDVTILPSVPHVATDMARSLLDFILIKVGVHADEIFCVLTKINVEGHNIDGDFLVIFDKESLAAMVRMLHEKYGGFD